MVEVKDTRTSYQKMYGEPNACNTNLIFIARGAWKLKMLHMDCFLKDMKLLELNLVELNFFW